MSEDAIAMPELKMTENGSLWLIGAAVLLVAGILGAVGASLTWATADFETSGSFSSSTTIEYGLFEVEGGGDSTKWTDEGADGQDGIGSIRAGGPIFATGVALVLAAALMLGAAAFVNAPWLPVAGASVTGLGLILGLVGFLLFVVGLGDFHQPGSSSSGGGGFQFSASVSELNWAAAGFILAILSLVGGVAGGVAAGMAWKRS